MEFVPDGDLCCRALITAEPAETSSDNLFCFRLSKTRQDSRQ